MGQDAEGIRTFGTVAPKEKGLGPGSAGQSGDTQGLSDVAEAGSESVEELMEEGQTFEAEAIGGVENAPDADVSEVHTKQFPEDDVPGEYQGRDQESPRMRRCRKKVAQASACGLAKAKRGLKATPPPTI
jgi:hypothetical protein